MTCRELADFIFDYESGELPDEVRARFDLHLAVCPDCVHYLNGYRATVELARATRDRAEETAAIPDELVRAILDARRAS